MIFIKSDEKTIYCVGGNTEISYGGKMRMCLLQIHEGKKSNICCMDIGETDEEAANNFKKIYEELERSGDKNIYIDIAELKKKEEPKNEVPFRIMTPNNQRQS